MFVQSLNTESLAQYVTKQINFNFPDRVIPVGELIFFMKTALQRTEYCFSKINIKYFFNGKHVFFNHLNTDQYAVFLYYLSNTIWNEISDEKLASKVYYLNKALHSLDIFYEIKLPDIFLLVHSVGTVLGRGDYQDNLVVYQRVTVGADKNDKYPVLGKGVTMYGGSAVIGDCRIGNNCLVSMGTIVMDKDIPDNMVVFKRNSQILYKTTKKSVIERYFISSE
ncbi:MAG: hypothetical protein K8S13_20115 [Desulfobacula sp.]|uniref:hypothetical protein n=1 Tax=Desulfobacula sp. TaxID=2593537 RepID=UPI0025BABBDB|nr:hypothetical protein [Desulfobacula sp.]MCD4722144.1 hypothetical protein [Desulfobacula sp.]